MVGGKSELELQFLVGHCTHESPIIMLRLRDVYTWRICEVQEGCID